MVKRRQRSDKTAIDFGENDIQAPSDEDIFGKYGSSDLENQPTEVPEFSGISAREAAMQRLEEARRSGASIEEIAELEQKLQQALTEIEAYERQAIIPLQNGKFGFRRFQFTAVGLEVPDDITQEELTDFLHALKEADDAIAWTVGDLANKAVAKWGEKYEELEKATGYKYQTLRDYAYVASMVDLSIRIDKLKFSHHRVVAPLHASEQKQWLKLCANNHWSVVELKQQIAESKRKPPIVIDALHQDILPKFSKVESALKRALKTRSEADVKKARNEVYQSRKAAEAYFEALEEELNNL